MPSAPHDSPCGMWQVWQVGAAACSGSIPVCLSKMPDTVFGRGVHLPLRMVDSHVTRPAGLGFTSLLDGKEVTRVAGVT